MAVDVNVGLIKRKLFARGDLNLLFDKVYPVTISVTGCST